jgi:hypothetical protein
MRRFKASIVKFFLFLIVLYILYKIFAPSSTPHRTKHDDYESELNKIYMDNGKNNHLPLRENNKRIGERLNNINDIKVFILK